MSRSKVLTAVICSIVVLAAGLAGYWYVSSQQGTNSKSKPEAATKKYADEAMADITKVGNEPTEDYKQSDGLYTKVIARQLILKITDQTTVSSFGADLKAVSNMPQTYILTVPEGKDLNEAAVEAKKKPGVEYAEVNHVTTGSAQPRNAPNDPEVKASQQSYLLDISAPEGWAVNTSGVDIAILDTGVQSNHPDLSSKILVNGGDAPGNGADEDANGYIDDYYGMDFINGSATANDANGAEDDNDHGTAVAGLAAAATNNSAGIAGISWNSRILSVKVMAANNAGSTLAFAQGVRYAVSRGVRVINYSAGRLCPVGTDCVDTYSKEAIDFATANNVIVVAAVGNGGNNAIHAPASYGPAIASGGTAVGESPAKRADRSNYGASGPFADISAPYEQYTTQRGSSYGGFAGTSGSTPIVSGAVALMLAMKPSLTPDRVEAILKATADGPASRGIGAGRLNLYKALQYTRDCP